MNHNWENRKSQPEQLKLVDCALVIYGQHEKSPRHSTSTLQKLRKQ